MIKVDVCVLGSGPGGYVCAVKCAQNGLTTACVEKDNVGGICLNWGCIPTKALLHCADCLNNLKEASQLGIDIEVNNIDINKMVDYSRCVVGKLSSGVEMLFKKNKVVSIKGFGKFVDKNTMEVKLDNGNIEIISAKYFVIATGAKPRTLDYEVDNDIICTYRGAMIPKTMPKDVIVIGGGVIGIEFANFYNAIGCNVVLLQSGKEILSTEDGEIVKKAKASFIKRGIDIRTNLKIINYNKNKKNIEIEYETDGQKVNIKGDKLILAIGVIPNIEGFGLDKINVEIDKNCIKTDEYCKTNINNIYAIGDCTYGPRLAHKASKEGIMVADIIAKNEGKIDKTIQLLNKSNIPSCIYSFPQIASIGLTEEQCKDRGMKYKVGTFSGIGNGKSIASNEVENFIKVIFDEKTYEILGCHMFGFNVSEMIHTISIAKSSELLPEDIENTIFAHPTVSEMIQEAFCDAFGKAIHK